MSEPELMKVLQASLYPGAAPESIKMVLSYCKAAGLDPMQKPVHIVPMWDGKAKQMRDVVMPGVNLYRTQAARSGECAGVTEPEFGPDVTEDVGGLTITYPAVVPRHRLAPPAHGRDRRVHRPRVLARELRHCRPDSHRPERHVEEAPLRPARQVRRGPGPAQGVPRDRQPAHGRRDGGQAAAPGRQHARCPRSSPSRRPKLLQAAKDAAEKGVAVYSDWWQQAGKENRVLLAAGHDERKRRAAEADKARTVEEPLDAEQQEHVDASA
jgi:hypothetical protein